MDQNSLDDHPATEVILRKMSSKESLHKHTSKGMSQNLNEAQSLRSLELSAKDTKTKLANLSVSRSFLDKLKFLETKSKGDYLKNPEQCSHNFYLPKSLLEKDE